MQSSVRKSLPRWNAAANPRECGEAGDKVPLPGCVLLVREYMMPMLEYAKSEPRRALRRLEHMVPMREHVVQMLGPAELELD